MNLTTQPRYSPTISYCLLSSSPACPACYNLVQDRVNDHREDLRKLADLINNATNIPSGTPLNDKDFEKKLAQLEEDLDETIVAAKSAEGMT